MVKLISDLASGEDLVSTGISHGNSTIRICGIYPAVRGISSSSLGNGTVAGSYRYDSGSKYSGLDEKKGYRMILIFT
jgi:hypothetical protein